MSVMVKANEAFDSLLKGFRKLAVLWLTLGTTIFGIILGFLMASPAMEVATSVVGILIHLVTIVVNPLNGLLLWVASNHFGELYINISLGESIPDLSPARFCVIFLSTLLLARAAIRAREFAPFTSTDAVGLVFLLGLAFSTVNEVSSWQEGVQYVFDRFYVPWLVYFFAKNLVARRRDVDKVLGAVLFFGVYAALYAIYEVQTGNILFVREKVYFFEYKEAGLHVLRGLLDRNDHFGALFCMVIPVNFYLYLKSSRSIKKLLYTVTLGILFLGLFFTYKRTAWIAIVVIFFVIQLFYAEFRRLFFVLLLVFVAVLGVTWSSVSQSAVVTNRIGSQVSTVEGRTNGWEAAIQLWAREPLFGYGPGSYRTVAEREGINDDALENAHLSVLFGTGLVGFVPYLAWYVFVLRDSIRQFQRARRGGPNKPFVDQDLTVISWGVLIAYIINYSATTANVHSVNITFYLLIGTLVGSQARFLAPSRRRVLLHPTQGQALVSGVTATGEKSLKG
jgi:O-antigen ligase